MISGDREVELRMLAKSLFEARTGVSPFVELPDALVPRSLEEAYFVQGDLARFFASHSRNGVGGWKVGATSPAATPLFAPMVSRWIAPSASVVAEPAQRLRGLEAEIAFLIGRDLPRRARSYTRSEIVDSIESCHPAIEVLETGLAETLRNVRLAAIADLQMHGGFVYGAPLRHWHEIDFAQESVTLSVDGKTRIECRASNPAGVDLIRLVLYLANEGSVRTDGLKSGTWITTGSWTGKTFASACSVVEVRFSSVGSVSLRFP